MKLHIRIILAEKQQRIIRNMKMIFLIGFISTTAKSIIDNSFDPYVEFPGKFANKNRYLALNGPEYFSWTA